MAENLDIRKGISLGIIFAFLLNTFGPIPLAQAQDYHLPAPGVMVHLSPEFNPPILKGIKVHPDNPFRFDFILDRGDSQLSNADLKEESSKLIKYFLASLTIPEKDLWVNLSPYEKDRIIPNSFGLTEMGRDLLAEDYMLKQITASLIYPEDEIGKKFWKRIYEEAYKKFGTTNIPVNTFNKVWIVPSKAVVYENAKTGTAYVVESKLKVMLEQDYLALNKNTDFKTTSRSKQWDQLVAPEVSALGSQVVREIVIPQLTKEVNEDKNFAHLRQVYNSLILATWYKKKIKDSILEQVYANKNKVAGVNIDDPREKERIYQRYLQAFKKGVFNYIKEDAVSTPGMPSKEQGIFPRKYFSGGEDLDLGVTDVNPDGALDVRESMPSQAIILDTENQKNLFTISEETAAANGLTEPMRAETGPNQPKSQGDQAMIRSFDAEALAGFPPVVAEAIQRWVSDLSKHWLLKPAFSRGIRLGWITQKEAADVLPALNNPKAERTIKGNVSPRLDDILINQMESGEKIDLVNELIILKQYKKGPQGHYRVLAKAIELGERGKNDLKEFYDPDPKLELGLLGRLLLDTSQGFEFRQFIWDKMEEIIKQNVYHGIMARPGYWLAKSLMSSQGDHYYLNRVKRLAEMAKNNENPEAGFAALVLFATNGRHLRFTFNSNDMDDIQADGLLLEAILHSKEPQKTKFTGILNGLMALRTANKGIMLEQAERWDKEHEGQLFKILSEGFHEFGSGLDQYKYLFRYQSSGNMGDQDLNELEDGDFVEEALFGVGGTHLGTYLGVRDEVTYESYADLFEYYKVMALAGDQAWNFNGIDSRYFSEEVQGGGHTERNLEERIKGLPSKPINTGGVIRDIWTAVDNYNYYVMQQSYHLPERFLDFKGFRNIVMQLSLLKQNHGDVFSSVLTSLASNGLMDVEDPISLIGRSVFLARIVEENGIPDAMRISDYIVGEMTYHMILNYPEEHELEKLPWKNKQGFIDFEVLIPHLLLLVEHFIEQGKMSMRQRGLMLNQIAMGLDPNFYPEYSNNDEIRQSTPYRHMLLAGLDKLNKDHPGSVSKLYDQVLRHVQKYKKFFGLDENVDTDRLKIFYIHAMQAEWGHFLNGAGIDYENIRTSSSHAMMTKEEMAMKTGVDTQLARPADQAMQASRLILTTSNKIAHQDKTLESRQELAGDIQRVLQTRNINSPVWLFGSSARHGLRSFHDVDIAVGNSVEENQALRGVIAKNLMLRIGRRGQFHESIHGEFLLSNLRALDSLSYGIIIRITPQKVQEIRDYRAFLRQLKEDELEKSSLGPMEIHHESEDRAMTGPNQEGDESTSEKMAKAAEVPVEDETENNTKEGSEDLTGHNVSGTVNLDLGPLTRERISWARRILDLPASNFPKLDEDVILWARLNKLMALKPGDPDASLKLEEEIELAAALLIRSLSNQARGAQPEVAGDQAMQTTSRVFKSKAVERLWKDLRKGAIPGELPTKFKGRTEQSIADEYGVSQSRVSALITGVIGEEYAGKGRRRKEMPREAGDRAMKVEVNLNRLEMPIHVLKDMPNPGDIAYETYTYLDMHNWLMNESAGFGNKVVKVRFRREADGGFIIEEIDNDTDKYAGILPPGAKTREVEINHVRQEKAYDGGKVTTTEIKIKEIELKDGRILELSPNDELLATIKDSDRIFYFEQVKDNISGKVTGRWQEKDSLVLTNMQEAIRNGWTTQDVVPRELSLDTIDQKGGISVTDIGLIRRMKFNQMKNGILMTSEHRQDGGWKRGTLHFSGNHPVVENPNASWENEEATVIIPLYKVPKSRIENFNLVDTWVRGDLELPEGSVVIGQEPLPENVNLGKAVYKIVPQDRISIEKFIGELGYTVTEGNWWAWSPEIQWNRYGAEFAEKEGLHYGVHFHSEAQRREHELNAKNSTERTEKGTDDAMAAFKKGGIDLTPANMHLQTQNNGGAIKFHMDPAMLKQLQSALGFVPVIINIQPMNNLREFLGLKQPAQSNVG